MPNRFSVLYADPPWFYARRSSNKKTKFGGGAEKHYPLMKDVDLLKMSEWVKSISLDNSIMFMWTTGPRLDFGITLLKAWGFRYCTTGFVWIKTKHSGSPIYGPGYYTASNQEIVLIGVKGRMVPVKRMVGSVIFAPRGSHSEKPNECRRRIELMYPGQHRRIELFAREPNIGWASWGLVGNMTSPDFF